MNNNQLSSDNSVNKKPSQKRNIGKKVILAVFLVLLIVGLAVGGWLLFNKDNSIKGFLKSHPSSPLSDKKITVEQFFKAKKDNLLDGRREEHVVMSKGKKEERFEYLDKNNDLFVYRIVADGDQVIFYRNTQKIKTMSKADFDKNFKLRSGGYKYLSDFNKNYYITREYNNKHRLFDYQFNEIYTDKNSCNFYPFGEKHILQVRGDYTCDIHKIINLEGGADSYDSVTKFARSLKSKSDLFRSLEMKDVHSKRYSGKEKIKREVKYLYYDFKCTLK